MDLTCTVMVKQTRFYLYTILFLSLAIITQQSQAATAVGRVVFVQGTPQAVDTGGTIRTLVKGSDVFSGDKLVSGSGRIQVSFVDGAFISVQPNSEYQIENYTYAGQPDGSENAVYRLLKGGVRAVTGLIGKQNPDAYKVHTAVATIGIRGTGHNTRICQGDCGNRDDGLYHNTWEGVTYVVNDVDSADVPAGKGVFVKDLTSKIEFLAQVPAVTAVETAKEKREKQQEEREDETIIIATGNERTQSGDQTIILGDRGIVPTSSTITSKLGAVGVLPDIGNVDGDDVDVFFFSDLSVFFDSGGKPVGFLGLEEDDDEFGNDFSIRLLATIDPEAVLGGNDPLLVSEAQSLFNLIDPATLASFRENPASVAEFISGGSGLGLGRWADGRVLSVDADGIAEIDELTGFQSIHFVFGPEADPITFTGSASYNLIAGTNSTSASGATIGNGAINGFIFVDFGLPSAFINLDVDHTNSLYSISGNLIVDGDEIFDMSNSVFAATGTPGSACNPMCTTFIDGGFAGPEASPGLPKHIGIEYDIQETDVITGVASFATP